MSCLVSLLIVKPQHQASVVFTLQIDRGTEHGPEIIDPYLVSRCLTKAPRPQGPKAPRHQGKAAKARVTFSTKGAETISICVQDPENHGTEEAWDGDSRAFSSAGAGVE